MQSRVMYPSLVTVSLYIVASTNVWIAEACSTRSTPKPRTPVTTVRPNITFQTYPCPQVYADWYCLNGATCFTVKIGESILYNCECASGYIGKRCEYKDLDESYPLQERVMVETASIAGGVSLFVLVIILVIAICIYIRQQKKDKKPDLYQNDASSNLFTRCCMKSSQHSTSLHNSVGAERDTSEVIFSPPTGAYQDVKSRESVL